MVMSNAALIGDKNSFGIEYAIQSRNSHVMGNMRLWFEGGYIGAFDDVNILSSILFELEGLDPKIIDGGAFIGRTVDEIYEYVKSGDNPNCDKYYFTPGEAFDDFSIVAYACEGNFNFIWKVHDDSYFEYSHYPEGIQSAQVSVSDFREVVMKFKKVLSEESASSLDRAKGRRER
jgi:hypothetical protein